jgi:hypothetical protein
MMRWSTHVMVHASGAEAAHYEAAIAAAEGGARVLLIETNPASAASWFAVLNQIPRRQVRVIWPKDDIHPVPDVRGTVH